MAAGIENILVVEKGPRSGDNWKRRYDRLHLHDIMRVRNQCLFDQNVREVSDRLLVSSVTSATSLTWQCRKYPLQLNFRASGGLLAITL